MRKDIRDNAKAERENEARFEHSCQTAAKARCEGCKAPLIASHRRDDGILCADCERAYAKKMDAKMDFKVCPHCFNADGFFTYFCPAQCWNQKG